MNEIGFKGKAEIVYNLGKAAEHARNAEINMLQMKGPHPQNRYNEVSIANAKMEAYIDSALHDNMFFETIKSFTQIDYQPLQDILKKESLQNGITNPKERFGNILIKNNNESAITTFLANI